MGKLLHMSGKLFPETSTRAGRRLRNGHFSPVAQAVLSRNRAMALIDGLFSQTNYVAAKKMLDATALRHEAIASNLANLETPGYKRIDLAPSFNEQLTRALHSNDSGTVTHLQPSLTVDSSAKNCSPDGNTVQLENELMQLSSNTLAHTVETQLISSNLLKLRLAITGRAN
jgi:flagellar basal-body rod protein FlgB